ncbi:o-succinylbenzoate synthase [Peribacillus alkalitolerans]|uniref:o-succinylbenzoate synthase n=1 Tax=Peribacillus alkalitolerans TaxID=1550385 RepID=UPI0013D5664B|nr:o-succinylbenzoate synthase [Peribacillus alkalitolerans]
MNIKEIHVHVIRSPLNKPFSTHLEVVKEREAIILELVEIDGCKGYGEVVAFSSPWYTEETIKTCLHALRDFLIPAILQKTINHPNDLEGLLAPIRGNRMAKAGLECAIWDLYAKMNNQPLYRLIGGTKQEVEAGVVIASTSLQDALSSIEKVYDQGYKRYKIKIHPSHDEELLAGIRTVYRDLPIMVDANSSYDINDMEQMRKLDLFNLMMIEQPFSHEDIVDHATLRKQINTPICLDESITSFSMAKSALYMQSCDILSIKLGRVGGLSEAIKIHNLCQDHSVPVWCGGMIEFGISKAFNLALASLPNFTLPGDFSSSTHYWERDIIMPGIKVQNGTIKLSNSPGIGFEIDEEALRLMGTKSEVYR